jgi:hypothetical protein
LLLLTGWRRRRLLPLRLWRPLLLMFLLLALLHTLLLLDMLLSELFKLPLLLLLHLLSTLLVSSLLIRALAFLYLLLLNSLALLVLLAMQVLQLLLMLSLELRIAVRRRIGRPSRRRTIVALIARRLIGLHIQRWIVRPIAGLRVWWGIIRPVVRIYWACGWRTVRALVVRPLVGRRSIWPVSAWRAVGLHIIGPLGIGRRHGRPVILRHVVRPLASTILVLRHRGPIARVLLRSRRPGRRCNPHRGLRLLLLLNLAHL